MELTDQCKGWLLTCDRNRQKQALKDAYNFLTQYIEEIYDDLVTEAIQTKLRQENKELTLELQLKQTKKVQNRLLFSIDTKVQCLIFVKINQRFKQIDPVLVVDRMMQDVNLRKKDITRYCHKILPVQRAFRAEHFKMLDVVDELFNQRSRPNQVKSWALNFKCRNNSKFNYKQILRQCEKIATKYGHFTDIYYPQWTLSIEITNHLMCLCISEKFKQYNEYKFHKKIPLEGREKKEEKIQQKVITQKQHNQKSEQPTNKQFTKESEQKQNQQQKQIKENQIRQKLQEEIIKPSIQDDVDLF